MYIAPNSSIMICRNIPINNSYEHTLYFASANAQYSYFYGQSKYIIDHNYYTRTERGHVRVQKTMAELIDCNYILFKNISFENKWFYAFITDIAYVNNEVTEISFELDVIQTFFFDYTLEQCFVERETSASDYIADNLMPENVSVPVHRMSNLMKFPTLDKANFKIVVAAPFKGDYSDSGGGLYGGVYSGLYFNVFDTYQDANDFIEGASADNKDNIVAVFMMPSYFISAQNDTTKPAAPQMITPDVSWTYSYNGKTGPRNKKLYTFPFNYLQVNTSDGKSKAYMYEYFTRVGDGKQIQLSLYGSMSCNPELQLVPVQYKGSDFNYDEALTCSEMPQCAWVGDAYKAWLAQNKGRLLIDSVSTGANFALQQFNAGGMQAGRIFNAPMSVGNRITGDRGQDYYGGSSIVNLFSRVAGILNENHVAGTLADPVHGNQTSTLAFTTNTIGFTYYFMRPTAEYASMIDDYFDKFGYSCKRIKVPNRSVRPHWTYTKTAGCVITGSIPYDVEQQLKAIYDNGITFWQNPSEVGNYSLDNSPSS